MRRGGNIGMFLQSIQHQDPHSTYNQDRLTASDSQYAALREEIKSAMSSGNQAPVTALTTKLHEMESAAFEARQEAQRQHIIDLGTGIFYFVGGVGIALGSNLSLGAIPHGRFDHPAFLHGQMTGDRLSVVCGVVEFALGKGITGGGELVMVASGGVLAPVAVPISAGGAALVTHGSLVVGRSLWEFSKVKEGQKHSGRNDKHTNRKAKSTAQKTYEDMKADLAGYKAEHGNKCDKQKLEWFKKQLKHWKRQADATGETHSRRGKG